MAESKDDDSSMTMKEREAWLRDHGVKIETPEDRREAAAAAPPTAGGFPTILDQLAALRVGGDSGGESNALPGCVGFVWIPADDSRPIRTLSLPPGLSSSSYSGDSLPEYVKPAFADGKRVDAGLVSDQASKQFAGGDLSGLTEGNTLSAAAMDAASAGGSVETFPLVRPADTNGYEGVYIHLDEIGMLKKLPQNVRASRMAEACGYSPAPSFYGDVFVGRVRTKPSPPANVDFVAGADTDPGCEWILRATSENVAWQQEMNKVTGRTGELQPGQAGTDGNAAAEEGYTWTQDEEELEVTVPFGSEIDKRKVKVTFPSRSIRVSYEGKQVVTISLFGAIDVDGCTWTIDGGKNLVVTCEKADAGKIWPRIRS